MISVHSILADYTSATNHGRNEHSKYEPIFLTYALPIPQSIISNHFEPKNISLLLAYKADLIYR